MNILDEIVNKKRDELKQAQGWVPLSELERQISTVSTPQNFREALESASGIGIIAEVKKASPSAGVIREDFDPVQIAKIYQENGASCISVLTDETYFKGSLDYLSMIREQVSIPLLRKDFILDAYQIVEARVAGADAILLIAEILDQPTLVQLLKKTHELGMEALVELYDAENLPRVLDSGAKLVGINNRNLRTFETSLQHTIKLAKSIPSDVTLVSESGIRTAEDVRLVQDAGAKAILVGESLMRAADIGAALQALLID